MDILNRKIQNLRLDFDPDKCKRKQPGALNNSTYTLAQLRPMVRSFVLFHGFTLDEYDDMKTSKTKMCAWIKRKLGNHFRPPRIPSPVQSPQRRQSPGRVQNLKDSYENEKAKACQKKSRINPSPYTGKEWITRLKEKYGFTHEQLKVYFLRKNPALRPYMVENMLTKGKITLAQKRMFCTMLEKYFVNGRRPEIVRNRQNNYNRRIKEYKDLHEARICKRKSVRNPNPYTTEEILYLLRNKYGFTDRQIQFHLAQKYPIFNRILIAPSQKFNLDHRKALCEMMNEYLIN